MGHARHAEPLLKRTCQISGTTQHPFLCSCNRHGKVLIGHPSTGSLCESATFLGPYHLSASEARLEVIQEHALHSSTARYACFLVPRGPGVNLWACFQGTSC